MRQSKMSQLTQNLASVSDKIRALDSAGYPRAEIAKFLGKRYQHVRNVLEQDKARKVVASQKAPATGPIKTRIGGEGRIVIPAPFRDALGVKEGDALLLRLEDGELRLAPAASVTQHVRALVRKFVPAGTSLVDELIAERRREADSDGE